MPSLTARDCYSKPDLGKIWERIREQGLQPFQEVDLLDADPPRKFNIVNPELGLRAPGNIPFLVLEAYEDMFTALFKTRDKYPAEAGDTCLFYIGHPGIGKTMFMLYAFVRCCVEGRPLALTWSSRLLYYLPDDGEPELLTDMDDAELDTTLHPDAVIICDSNNEATQPLKSLRLTDRLLAVTTSPQSARWRWARKDANALAYYVPVPTGFDITALAQSVGGIEGRRIVELEALIGPSPRQLMKLRQETDNEVLAHFRDLAEGVTLDLTSLIRVLRDKMVPDQNQVEGFHDFFYVTLQSTSDRLLQPRRKVSYRVGTQWLLRVLQEAIFDRVKEVEEDLLARVSQNNSVFGMFYRPILLRRIKVGQVFSCYIICGESGKAFPSASARRSVLPYQPAYLDQSAALPELSGASHFFITVALDFPTVDAVIVTPARVLLLKVTDAARHRLLQSGLKRVHQLIEHNNMLSDGQWHFIFLAPTEGDARRLCYARPAANLKAYAQSTLQVDLRFGYMTVTLGHSWNSQPIELLNDSRESPRTDLDSEESDVHMTL